MLKILRIDIQISSSSTQSGFVNVACSKDYTCILHCTPGGVFKDSCQLRFLLGLPAQQLSPDDQGPVRILKRSGRVDRILAGSVRRIHRNLRRRDFRSHRRSSALQRVSLPLRRVSGTPHAGPDVHVVEAGKMKFRFGNVALVTLFVLILSLFRSGYILFNEKSVVLHYRKIRKEEKEKASSQKRFELGTS